MARPTRCREINSLPDFWTFSPEDESLGPCIILTLDELETIKLLDKEGMTQEECALQMNVARTTVTAVYESARKKIATAIIEGRRLVIGGGMWHLKNETNSIPENFLEKREKIMRIAVTYENGQVFQHFGHTENFKIYDIEEGKIINSEVVNTNGQGHGALAGFLKNAKVDTLICGGIGGGAQMALSEAGIKLYGGVIGNADSAVEDFINGKLNFNPNVHCDHHGHGENREHSCHSGGHSCSNH